MQLSQQFKTYFELDDHTWREIFVNAQFSDSFKFITQNYLFSSFAKVISHPYQELKLTLLREGFKKKNNNFYGIFQKGGGVRPFHKYYYFRKGKKKYLLK